MLLPGEGDCLGSIKFYILSLLVVFCVVVGGVVVTYCPRLMWFKEEKLG